MRFYTETLGLSDAAFVLLRDLVHQHTGLCFDDKHSDLLADKLSPLVVERGFDSFLDYYYFLKYDPEARADWSRVMDALSVQETYFWREMDQVNALVRVVIPEFVSAHPGETIRIWSAACASGEEPLSIAMALNEAGLFQRASFEILGSDASPLAIQKAETGLYRERAFRTLPPELRNRYFVRQDNVWQVSRELKQHVKYSTANLVDGAEVAALTASQVIFCRNVFIYFSEDSVRRTVNQFARHMRTPGYLFLGAAESLLKLTTDFALEQIDSAFVYVKR